MHGKDQADLSLYETSLCMTEGNEPLAQLVALAAKEALKRGPTPRLLLP